MQELHHRWWGNLWWWCQRLLLRRIIAFWQKGRGVRWVLLWSSEGWHLWRRSWGGQGIQYFNEFNAESDDHFVDSVCVALAESSIEGPEQRIMIRLSKKQVVKNTNSDVSMSLRKSPPETLIDQSTTQNILMTLTKTKLPTTLVASSAKKLLIFNCHLKKNLRSRECRPSSQRPQQR